MNNRHNIEYLLTRMGKKEVHAPHEKAALRHALLSVHRERAARPGIAGALNLALRSLFMPLGAIATIIVIISPSFGVGANIAQAQELVEKSIARAQAMPSGERQELETDIRADLFQTLSEANMAADLEVLTPEEYAQESLFAAAQGEHEGPAVSRNRTLPVRYLSYTSARGSRVVLGLDRQDTPVYRAELIQTEEFIRGRDGLIGVTSQLIRVINVNVDS